MYPIEKRCTQNETIPTTASIAAPSGSYRMPSTMFCSAGTVPRVYSQPKEKPCSNDSWKKGLSWYAAYRPFAPRYTVMHITANMPSVRSLSPCGSFRRRKICSTYPASGIASTARSSAKSVAGWKSRDIAVLEHGAAHLPVDDQDVEHAGQEEVQERAAPRAFALRGLALELVHAPLELQQPLADRVRLRGSALSRLFHVITRAGGRPRSA